jgi:hypothetical protein
MAHAALWGLAQQCPIILNCPQGLQVFPDISNNDTVFWNVDPYTWSPTTESADLFEGAADLNLKILGCPTGGPVTVQYTLFFDLDNDNLAESVLRSIHFPPAGKLLANNAFNQGYTGGDTMRYDRRPEPDSLLFRFGLEYQYLGDTTTANVRWHMAASPTGWILPRIPEGKHRIEWTVKQDGAVRTCQYAIRVKDVKSPDLACKNGATVVIDSSGAGALNYSAVFQSVFDNVTPAGLIQFSLRKAGQGMGFPLDSLGHQVPNLVFHCPEMGPHPVEMWAKDRSGNTASCTAGIVVTGTPVNCPPAHPVFCSEPFWSPNATIRGMDYKLGWHPQDLPLQSRNLPVLPSGCGILDSLPPTTDFTVTPVRNNDLLNGITTYDLVLISRHILGVTLFDAPWKMIAADVNNSGSVTTADVILLRRALLGLSSEFPGNTSWRFYMSDCVFPPVPFGTYCPSELTFNSLPFGQYNPEYQFNGLKVGDVNGSADYDSLSAPAVDRTACLLKVASHNLQPGEIIEIPVTSLEPAECSGFQLALRFDAGQMTLLSILPGELPGMDGGNFGRPEPGVIAVSWSDARPQWVAPGMPLFTLRMKALTQTTVQDAIRLQNSALRPEWYGANDEIRPLELSFGGHSDNHAMDAVFPAQPNPTSDAICIPLRLQGPEMVELEVLDASGKSIFQLQQPFEPGTGALRIPANAFPGSGLYLYRVRAGKLTGEGKIVRL